MNEKLWPWQVYHDKSDEEAIYLLLGLFPEDKRSTLWLCARFIWIRHSKEFKIKPTYSGGTPMVLPENEILEMKYCGSIEKIKKF